MPASLPPIPDALLARLPIPATRPSRTTRARPGASQDVLPVELAGSVLVVMHRNEDRIEAVLLHDTRRSGPDQHVVTRTATLLSCREGVWSAIWQVAQPIMHSGHSLHEPSLTLGWRAHGAASLKDIYRQAVRAAATPERAA